MKKTRKINGRTADVRDEFVAYYALDSEGQIMSNVMPSLQAKPRINCSNVVTFASRVGASYVEAVRQFSFAYDERWEMSVKRGKLTKTTRYSRYGKPLFTSTKITYG